MSMSPDPDRHDLTAAGIQAERDAHDTAVREQRARADGREPLGSLHEPLPSTPVLLAGLSAGINDLREAAKDVYRASVLSRVERVVLLSILLINLTIGGVVGVGVLRLNGIAQTNRTNGQTVLDCTQPGGACYQRAQAQTAAAVAQLNLVTIIATECSDSHHGPALHTCILNRIQAGK